MKILGAYIKEAQSKRECSELHTYSCSCLSICPILEKGKCIHRRLFSKCVYGNLIVNKTHTKMASSYRTELENFKKILGSYPKLPEAYYDNMFEFIGDFVYLPYSQINHLDGKHLGIPFKNYSSAFSFGSEFLNITDFTVETIIKFLKLRPQALMGGEIKNYQEKELPRFVSHLKIKCPELYNNVKLQYPEIEKYCEKIEENLDKAEIKCPINIIPAGVTDGYYVDFYKGELNKVKFWDGETLEIEGPISFIGIYAEKENISIRFIPNQLKTKVVIVDKELKTKIINKYPEYLKF